MSAKKKTAPKKKLPEVELKPETLEDVAKEEATNQVAEHTCTRECLPSQHLKGNLQRMNAFNARVEYVLAFKPQIDRRLDGVTTVIIGEEKSQALITMGDSVHIAMMKMFDLLTGR